MKTRREFITSLAAASALSLVSPSKLFAKTKNKYIGIQLYTIREKLKEDFLGSLEEIADIGYNSIETAGYQNGKFYGYPPKEFLKLTKKVGLKALSSHADIQKDSLQKTIDDTLEAGMEYLVKPWLSPDKRKTIDDYIRLAEDFNKIGEQCNQSGLRFAYHNHAFEFEKTDGQIPYDILLENTEAHLLTMQLDTYWMVYGGMQPIDYFKRYPHRFELLHIKDMDDSKDRESTEIGSGIIDFPAIFDAQKQSGMKYFFVEQESFKMPEFESLAKSCDYLKNLKI